MSPIRYFGLLDFGGRYGRPHVHYLVWNAAVTYIEPTKYQKGLPRPRYYFKQWPYGHVDVGEYNTATVNYTTGYIVDFDKDLALASRTIRPAIGYFGLKVLAEIAARSPTPITGPPTMIQLDGRSWPLDKWSRSTFTREYLVAGGDRTILQTTAHGSWVLRSAVARIYSELYPLHLSVKDDVKVARFEDGREKKAREKAAKERDIERIYYGRKASTASDNDDIEK